MNYVCDLCHITNQEVISVKDLGVFLCYDCMQGVDQQDTEPEDQHEHDYQLNGTDAIGWPDTKHVIVYSCSQCGNEIYEPIPEEQ